MTTDISHNWNEGNISGLVPLATHSIFLHGSGPIRTAGAPAVILEAGSGSNSIPHAAVHRLISEFARVYSYDRSGSGRSEASPSDKRDAGSIATELSSLLEAAKIPPPYILVAHSYGGIIVREFLEQRVKEEKDGGVDVVGMVLIDTNHEDTWKERLWPFQTFQKVTEGIDWIGTMDWETRHKLTPEEWAAFKNDKGGDQSAILKEHMANEQSHTALGAKKQLDRQVLGDRPLSVIKGSAYDEFKAVFEVALERGQGTGEQREEIVKALERLRPLDERLKRDQLRLSRNSRYVYADQGGHNINLTQPDLIAQEVRWVLANLC